MPRGLAGDGERPRALRVGVTPSSFWRFVQDPRKIVADAGDPDPRGRGTAGGEAPGAPGLAGRSGRDRSSNPETGETIPSSSTTMGLIWPRPAAQPFATESVSSPAVGSFRRISCAVTETGATSRCAWPAGASG